MTKPAMACNAAGSKLNSIKLIRQQQHSRMIKRVPLGLHSSYKCPHRRVPLSSSYAIPPLYTGDGGGIGGSNGNGGGGGDDDNFGESDGGARFGGNAWILALIAAAGLGLFGLNHKRNGNPSFRSLNPLQSSTKSEDVLTLKRLVREVFSELVKMRTRISDIENALGITAAQDVSTSAATPLIKAPVAPKIFTSRGPSGPSTVSGSLEVGGGLLWADDEVAAGSTEAVKETGVRLGTDLLFRIGAKIRNGSDLVLAECRADPIKETMSLQKVLYNYKLLPFVRMVMAPFGARGQDVAYTLNPVAGRGLTSLVKHGSPLHQNVLGSLFGAAVDLQHAWLGAGYFSRIGEDGSPAYSLLGQAVVEALPGLSVGLTYLQHKEGSLLMQDTGATQLSLADTQTTIMGGESVPQLCGTFALRLPGDMALNGWAGIDSPEEFNIENLPKRPNDWGMVLSSKETDSSNGWLVAMGHLSSLGAATTAADSLAEKEPNMLEMSLQMDMGDGMMVMPGVVVMRQRGQNTVFAGMRAAWQY